MQLTEHLARRAGLRAIRLDAYKGPSGAGRFYKKCGYALVHEENCLVADTPREFARACLRLLAAEGDRRRLGEAARTMALRLYAQETVTAHLREAVRAVCGKESG